MRAIQPMKCTGIKCGSPLIPVASELISPMSEMDMLVPQMRQQPIFEGFSFKESDSKSRNLRGKIY